MTAPEEYSEEMRRAVYRKMDELWTETEPGSFTVAYSGGLDSTIVAWIMGKRYAGEIHLWTLHHNYGSLFVRWSKKHAQDMQRIFGAKRVFHTINNVSKDFQRLTLDHFWADLREYGHFIWCLGCQTSMMAEIIAYNLIRGIPRTFMCSSVGGEYAVMSMPATRKAKARIYRKYGIDYRFPLLEISITKPEERLLMQDAGMWVGYQFRRGVHGVQPICIPGLQHLGDVVLDMHTAYPPERVEAYIESREPLIHEIVTERLRAAGVDLDEAVARNEEQLKNKIW
ncbi:MAG: hypothetical protein P9L99_18320 [Candidatus Lernaella stagnicola]|nr:hypothetical protein [Candidatus Lernaella stagnicola]